MKKRISAILACIFTLCTLISCAPAETSRTVVDFKAPVGTSSVSCVINGSTGDLTNCFPHDPDDIRPGFENLSFDGYTFVFASPLSETDGWEDYEVYAEENGSGVLDASIAKRNALLRRHYDCKVQVMDIEDLALRCDHDAGLRMPDIVLSKYNLVGKAKGDYYNYYDLNIDFYDKPWFDQSFTEDVTVDGKLYVMLGAFSLTSFDATMAMFFNKNVQNKTDAIKDIDFYDLVKNGEWTLDKFCEISKLAACDSNKDGEMTLGEDTFGYVSTDSSICGLYFGAGQNFLNKRDNAVGETEFFCSFDNSDIEITDRIISIYGDKGTTVTDNSVKTDWQIRSDAALFVPGYLKKAAYYSIKYGSVAEKSSIDILPFPSFTEEQSKAGEYNHYVDNHYIYMCVPKTCTDIQRISDFIEVYAYHSYYTVYKDYINLYKNTYATDPRSGDMVETILRTRSFDLTYQFNWAAFPGEYIFGVKSGNNIMRDDALLDTFDDALIFAANRYKSIMKSAHP